ncbi:hypothetical protein F5Y19DRAFT_493085 [Xylariaceae sp. FL1651]|nr:hypothetical protein F5Y19DRAFT_493085 [Xylariaceae sp. FL1651]
MQFQPSAALIFGLVALVSAGPIMNEADVNEVAALVKRGGDHSANFFTGSSCTGSSLASSLNFGCGGTCIRLNGAHSILLNEQTTDNPKPTASLFSDGNCKNQTGSAGINSGQNAGCTNLNTAANSAYLYYNCH